MTVLYPLLATNALTFALQESSIPGKIVLAVLFVGSIFSWAIMVTKIRMLNFARRQTEHFLTHFRSDREPLRLYRDGANFDGAPAFAVYVAGCDELAFQLLGSTEIDETFHARLEMAPKISPVQHRAVVAAMERAVKARVKIDGITQTVLADLRPVVPHLVVDLREVDIVDPGR